MLQFIQNGFSGLLRVVSIVLLIVLSLICSLVYPQIARYKNSLKQYWRNALLLCLPKMWLLLPNLLLFIFPEIVMFFRLDVYLYCLILRLMLLFGFQFYLSSLLMKKLFQPLETH